MSLNTDCLQALTQFADVINNTDASLGLEDLDQKYTTQYLDGVWPHPVFWDQTNCNGSATPSYATQVPEGYQVSLPTSRSFYIPPRCTVLIGRQQYPSRVSDYPVLMTNTSVSGHATFHFYRDSAGQHPYQFADWISDRCQNKVSTLLGQRLLTAYSPQSFQCDSWAHDACAHDLARHGHYTLELCNCRADEAELQAQYCDPDQTHGDSKLVSVCKQNQLIEYLPVTCFGRRCSKSGYRFARMTGRTCNEQLCRQIIDVSGDNLAIAGQTTLYCGNVQHSTQVKSDGTTAEPDGDADSPHTPPTAFPAHGEDTVTRQGLSPWVTAALILLGGLVVIVLPVTLLMFYRHGSAAQQAAFKAT